jgi:hypothetical protein
MHVERKSQCGYVGGNRRCKQKEKAKIENNK